ncbi:PIN-like domain-containing protein [Pseudomonas sp. SDT291_1_S447]
MKSSFAGFYAPTPEQYEVLWKEALFVLDTNVLLNLYRLPTLARNELIGLLELLKDRIWIPHQVGLEFQRGRLTVIASERKSTEEALTAAQSVVGQVKNKVEGLQIDKRGLGIESKPLLDELEKSNQKLIDAITKIHTSQLDVSSADLIRQKLDELLEGRVGKAPSTQAELDALVSDGDERFSNKIPPGFADLEKDKNPNESSFVYDHIKYQRKFGDLILWKQLLEHVKESKTKKVLFITADRKEDWWWREQGKTIGPHPELMREITRTGGVELFWMYSSVQFVEHANKYSKAKVSTQSVAEIEQVAQNQSDHIYPRQFFRFRRSPNGEFIPDTSLDTKSSRIYENETVYSWLSRKVPELKHNPRGLPEFIKEKPEGLHGYLLSRGLDITSYARDARLPQRVQNALYQVEEGELCSLSVIFILSEKEADYLLRHQAMLVVRERIEAMLRLHSIAEVYIGLPNEDEFEVFLHHRGYPRRSEDLRDDSLE